ncbi:MAG: hypothetical protein KAS47_08390 [Candidatus Heimdallarchaeota archaeon]|nr:hypothetical protein [Candidatus Heimdallarchaeota archaeon]
MSIDESNGQTSLDIRMKKHRRKYSELLLEPKTIWSIVLRVVIFLVISGVLLGLSLPFLGNNWSVYIAILGAVIGVVGLLHVIFLVNYSSRDKNTYLLTKDGRYVTDLRKEVKKYSWKQISDVSVFTPGRRFAQPYCVITTTESKISIPLSHYMEKNIGLKTSKVLAQAIAMFYKWKLLNLRRILQG